METKKDEFEILQKGKKVQQFKKPETLDAKITQNGRPVKSNLRETSKKRFDLLQKGKPVYQAKAGATKFDAGFNEKKQGDTQKEEPKFDEELYEDYKSEHANMSNKNLGKLLLKADTLSPEEKKSVQEECEKRNITL